MMEITSRKNEKVVHLKKLGSSSTYRNEHGEFFGDGIKLLREASLWGIEVHDIFYANEKPDFNIPGAVFYKTDYDIIRSISPLITPQDIVFSAKIPCWNDVPALRNSIIIENVQDPGNVGTIIRTANAFGVENVLLIGNCADIWSSKTIRASMGAVFREKVFSIGLDTLEMLKTSDNNIYAATLNQNSADIRSISLENCAVCIGNEGNGLTEELISLCDGSVIIPMKPMCESLNAANAAAILMWEMSKSSL